MNEKVGRSRLSFLEKYKSTIYIFILFIYMSYWYNIHWFAYRFVEMTKFVVLDDDPNGKYELIFHVLLNNNIL